MKKRAVLRTARGFDQATTNATSISKQHVLTFDDVSFMSSRRFFGKRSSALLIDRRIEFYLSATPVNILEAVRGAKIYIDFLTIKL